MNAIKQSFCAIAVIIFSVIPAFSLSISLEGAEFGNARTMALQERVMQGGRPSVRARLKVGGAAFVQTAQSQDGWVMLSLDYRPDLPDGDRWRGEFSAPSQDTRMVPLEFFDWEVVPILQFVQSDDDSAFTYFGEYAPGVVPTAPDARPLGYHPSLSNTLVGLRAMQLDLLLFAGKPFAGYFKDASGSFLIGPGESRWLPTDIDYENTVTFSGLTEQNYRRVIEANEFIVGECGSMDQRSQLWCRLRGQPHDSYIVGDTRSPIAYAIYGDNIQFNDKGICWDFSRTEPEENNANGNVIELPELSDKFCDFARENLNGIHNLVYQSNLRIMQLSALLRHFKAESPRQFQRAVLRASEVSFRPNVETPTEIVRVRGR